MRRRVWSSTEAFLAKGEVIQGVVFANFQGTPISGI